MLLADDLQLRSVYYLQGSAPRGSAGTEIKDPPCSGWQLAVIVPGEKRTTIFCPFTLVANQVRSNAVDLAQSTEPRDGVTPERIAKLIRDKWVEYQGLGFNRDYDTAALVLRRLGYEVPAQVLRGGEEDTRKRGGKEAEASLKKPVKRSSKRGKFLQWFLDHGGSASVREAMAEFGMTRSNALSYLFNLQKDHGIGYGLTGDVATLEMPEGDPFDTPAEAA